MIQKNQKFAPLGCCIANKEDKDTYTKICEFVSNNVLNPPKLVMADGDKSISGAVKDVWPSAVRINCFFHIEQCLKRDPNYLSLKKNKEEKANTEDMISDIGLIQTHAVNKENFLKLVNLFKEKWLKFYESKSDNIKAKVEGFLQYVMSLATNYTWGMFANPGHSLTNNALGKH